jgi:Protein of unknown function (DUF3024)
MPHPRQRPRRTTRDQRRIANRPPNDRAAGHPAARFAFTPVRTAASVTSFPMPIPETDLHRIRTWAANHSPVEVRSQVWVELDITSTAVTVYECRPYWRPEGNQSPTRSPVARCKWNNNTKQWTLYWQRRDLKFHIWPHLDPQPTIATLLAEIDDHSNGAFWG